MSQKSSFQQSAQSVSKALTPDTREDFVEQRAEQATNHVVTIRWRDGVAKDMRFVYRGRKLRIQSAVDPDERRRFLICQCEEIS